MDTKKASGIFRTAILIIALIFFIIVAVFQFYETKTENSMSERVVLGFDSGGDYSVSSALMGRPAPMGDLMGVVAGGCFMIVDKSGSSVTEDNFMLSDPVLSSAGSFCAVGDYGGRCVRLYESGKLITEITAEGSIISLVTNSGGFFAVATEQTGYDAVITVYRKGGEAIYRYKITGKSFVDMDISANNRRLLISEVNTEYGSEGSTLTIVDFNREDAQSVLSVPGIIYFSVHFNKNGSFVCLSSSGLDIYRPDCEKLNTIDFSSRRLLAADISHDDMICLAFSSSDSLLSAASVMEIYGRDGKLKGETQFSEPVEYICVNGSFAAVSYGNRTDIVKGNGKVKTSLEASSPVKYAAPFSGGSSAVVFSGGNTEILKG